MDSTEIDLENLTDELVAEIGLSLASFEQTIGWAWLRTLLTEKENAIAKEMLYSDDPKVKDGRPIEWYRGRAYQAKEILTDIRNLIASAKAVKDQVELENLEQKGKAYLGPRLGAGSVSLPSFGDEDDDTPQKEEKK